MIKKVIIEKYGPFKNQKINLENNVDAIHIIGMNDVGKTVLLNAIQAYGKGLNKKFTTPAKNGGGKIIDNVKTVFQVSKGMYNKELIEKLKKVGLEPFEGEVRIFTNGTEFSKDSRVFVSSIEMKCWAEKAIEGVRKHLKSDDPFHDLKIDDAIQGRHLDRLLMQNLTRHNLGKNVALGSLVQSKEDYWRLRESKRAIYESENTTNRETILKKMSSSVELYLVIRTLEDFKSFFFSLISNSCVMIRANSKDNFDFIQDSYIIKDSTNKNGDDIFSEWRKIRRFFMSFFKESEVNVIESIINSDMSEEDKMKELKVFGKKAEKEMAKFYSDYFPSQNIKMTFDFGIDLGSNKFTIWVKDKVDERYTTLNERSDGFRWFLKLFVVIRNLKPYSTLIIDEPEKFLHASAQKELVKLLLRLKKKMNIQIIYATHSVYMLTNNIFPALKIVSKENESSVIYENISELTNKKNGKFKDVLLPISTALGINIWELVETKVWERILMVEGEADIYTLKIGSTLAKKEMTFMPIPLLGKSNPYSWSIVRLLGVDYKILLDKDAKDNKKETNFFEDEKIEYIDELSSFNCSNPEELLSLTTRKKYNITDKSTTHKIGWQDLWNDIYNNKYELHRDERKKVVDLFNKTRNLWK